MSFSPSSKSRSVGISRRQLLRNATIATSAAPILAIDLAPLRAKAEQPEPGKLTQAKAGYQTSPKNGERCVDCAYFQPPASCSLVSGTISRAGWCKFWLKKT